jgi:hypothetical protein
VILLRIHPFGSNDAVEPDTAVSKGSSEMTRNINDTSDLDHDFVLIGAEDADAEGYNCRDTIIDSPLGR